MIRRMNIKNAEVHVIAKELAREAGTTMTQAVLEALRWWKEQLNGMAKAKVTGPLDSTTEM